MMFTVKIATNNAAMRTRSDIADALRHVANQLDQGESPSVIMDANGNTVGRVGIGMPRKQRYNPCSGV